VKNITNKRTFVIYMVLVAGIAVFANLVSRRMFFRWDLTESKIYTLSASSKSVIGKLDDRLLAKVYFSDNLPGQYANNRRYLQDMLEEFQAYSDGNFHFEFARPEDDRELEQEAQRYGIPPMQLQAIENDRMEIKNVWMGLALLYEDRREVIPVIQTTAGLEYQLASAIKKLIDTDKRTVGIVNDPEWQGKNQTIQQLLSQTYNVRFVELASPAPPDIDLLLANGITDSLDTASLYHLDQYVMSGRPLFLAQYGVSAQLERGMGHVINSNLFDLLENYGIHIEQNLLVDKVCSQVAVESQRGIFRIRNAVDYPFFPVIQAFNEDHVIVEGLEQARLFFTSEVTSSIPGERQGRALFQPLMTTSDFTGVANGPMFNLGYQDNPSMAQLNGAGRVAAGLLSGELHSYFTAESRPDSAAGHVGATQGGQILVVGDGAFLSDEAGGRVPENLNLLLNAVDYLVGDEELIVLRSREVTARPLKEMPDGVRRTLKWANIFGPSVLVLTLGLWRWRTGRNRRKYLEDVYGR